MTELWGRRIQPAALALTLALSFLGLTWISGNRSPGDLDVVTAVYAFLVAALLVAAWAANSGLLMRWALLGSVGAWAFAITALGGTSPTSTLLAVAWMILAVGSYWLEVTDTRSRHQGPT